MLLLRWQIRRHRERAGVRERQRRLHARRELVLETVIGIGVVERLLLSECGQRGQNGVRVERGSGVGVGRMRRNAPVVGRQVGGFAGVCNDDGVAMWLVQKVLVVVLVVYLSGLLLLLMPAGRIAFRASRCRFLLALARRRPQRRGFSGGAFRRLGAQIQRHILVVCVRVKNQMHGAIECEYEC